MNIPFSCVEPFKTLNVEKQHGQLKVGPCCGYDDEQFIDSLADFNFQTNTHFIEIREMWKNGQVPKGCDRCVKNENTSHSKRRVNSFTEFLSRNIITDTKEFFDVELTNFEFWIGDTCNMACITCGPNNSSLWKNELNLVGPSARKITNNEWAKLDLSSINWIHFHGGEPFLLTEHIDLITSLPKLDNIALNYNTNASVKPNQELLDLWKQCKEVHISMSIDDTEDRFEYIRYPGNWEKVQENISWMVGNCGSNVRFSILRTINILNQFYLETVPDWAMSKNYEIKTHTQNARGVLAPDGAIGEAIEYLDNLDKRRSTDWKQVFPRAVEKLI